MKNKNIVNISFFSMLFSLSLLCIFLYFGENEMKYCEKLIVSVFIGVIAVLAIICICASSGKNAPNYKEQLYVDEAGVFVLYSGKKNSKICHIQYYESVEELKNFCSKQSKIYIKPNVEISSDFLDYLRKGGYEFSILNPNTTVIIKNKNTNSSNGEEKNQKQKR